MDNKVYVISLRDGDKTIDVGVMIDTLLPQLLEFAGQGVVHPEAPEVKKLSPDDVAAALVTEKV